jgi:cold shock CspA family protein
VRTQGTITEWKASQGFGFITPSAGGERVFAHRTAFQNRKRQPSVGAAVLYELAPHKSRRVCASKVAYVMDAAATRATRSSHKSTSWFAIAFLSLLAAITIKGYLPTAILALYLLASLITYFAYAIDKSPLR